MLRKIAFGLLWFVVLYFTSAVILGGIAGGMAGTGNAQDAYAAGQQAGKAVVTRYAHWLLLGSALLAGVGAASGFLPGTRTRKDKPEDGSSRTDSESSSPGAGGPAA